MTEGVLGTEEEVHLSVIEMRSSEEDISVSACLGLGDCGGYQCAHEATCGWGRGQEQSYGLYVDQLTSGLVASALCGIGVSKARSCVLPDHRKSEASH